MTDLSDSGEFRAEGREDGIADRPHVLVEFGLDLERVCVEHNHRPLRGAQSAPQ
jgi:hypothetical protein